MDMLALAFGAWISATILLTALFLDWTGSLFVSVPAALCVTTGVALLLVHPTRR
jgi:hypothetical protein